MRATNEALLSRSLLQSASYWPRLYQLCQVPPSQPKSKGIGVNEAHKVLAPQDDHEDPGLTDDDVDDNDDADHDDDNDDDDDDDDNDDEEEEKEEEETPVRGEYRCAHDPVQISDTESIRCGSKPTLFQVIGIYRRLTIMLFALAFVTIGAVSCAAVISYSPTPSVSQTSGARTPSIHNR